MAALCTKRNGTTSTHRTDWRGVGDEVFNAQASLRPRYTSPEGGRRTLVAVGEECHLLGVDVRGEDVVLHALRQQELVAFRFFFFHDGRRHQHDLVVAILYGQSDDHAVPPTLKVPSVHAADLPATNITTWDGRRSPELMAHACVRKV